MPDPTKRTRRIDKQLWWTYMLWDTLCWSVTVIVKLLLVLYCIVSYRIDVKKRRLRRLYPVPPLVTHVITIIYYSHWHTLLFPVPVISHLQLQARREGGRGKFSRAPRRLGGQPSLKNTDVFQMASFWPKICIKSTFGGRPGLRPGPGLGSLITTLHRTPGRMVGGHLSPRFFPLDAFGVSISRHTQWPGEGW